MITVARDLQSLTSDIGVMQRESQESPAYESREESEAGIEVTAGL